MPAKPLIHCAIYTRKSSDEGLEQEFNSLDAQREACDAYIRSQCHEGWRALEARYDDGGFSGGSMNRPALQQLLSDIGAGLIDIVVVYKVDRLTRSLMDFSKIVETFDGKGASFVSVTQQFSTTTSMGRLTLNMLLSFAQFEREVTGERIRDKIAASKQKGMWMGGRVPLGYEANGRTLTIIDVEAGTLRGIFHRYLELGSVRQLKEELDRLGHKTKPRRTPTGDIVGGSSFSRGNLYSLLSNHLYVGEITHRGQSYPGQHPAIVDRETWEAVQRQLATNRLGHRDGINAAEPSLLAGLIFDSQGGRLTPTHTGKQGRRYRYYASPEMREGGSDSRAYRIPAHEAEELVRGALITCLKDRDTLVRNLSQAADVRHYILKAAKLAEEFAGASFRQIAPIIRTIVKRVIVGDDQIELVIALGGLSEALGVQQAETEDETSSIRIPARLKRCGVSAKLILQGDHRSMLASRPDPALIKAIVRARDWFGRLTSGQADGMSAIAAADNVSASFVTRALRLAFLAPDIVQSILDGKQPRSLTIDRLLQRSRDLPLGWEGQRRILGFS